jgi:hypothetical protein
MKSGGWIGGQMSSHSPVVWWYREVNCEVVGMCVEAVPVSVDFLFNLRGLKIFVGGPYSARTMVLRSSCAGLSLGSVRVFRLEMEALECHCKTVFEISCIITTMRSRRMRWSGRIARI